MGKKSKRRGLLPPGNVRQDIVQRRSNRLASKAKLANSIVSGDFAIADFIAPTVAHFLGVQSLLRFGATCKAHQVVVSREILRRKEYIAEIGEVVAWLLTNQKQCVELTEYIEGEALYDMDLSDFPEDDDATFIYDNEATKRTRFIENSSVIGDNEAVNINNPLPGNVIAANQMAYDGMRLIDDELFALHKKGARVSDGIYEDLSPRGRIAFPRDLWDTDKRKGSLFKRIADQIPSSVLEQFDVLKSISEDMKNAGFCRQSIFRRECDALLSLTNFPAMFYFPSGKCWDRSLGSDSDYDDDHDVDRISSLSRGAIRKASRHVAMVRAAFLMKGFETAEALMHSGMQCDTDRANASIKIHECINSTAWGLARDGIIDAFRIVAREAVFKFPDDELRDCFWYAIKMADDCHDQGIVQRRSNQLVSKAELANSIVGGVLAIADFIAPTVAQFLGVQSLLRFGATCKAYHVVVSREIVRRKESIAEIGEEVARLLTSQKQSVELTEYIEGEALYGMEFSDFPEDGSSLYYSFNNGATKTRFIEKSSVIGDDVAVNINNPLHASVIAANQMVYDGMRLIDDELFALHKKGATVSDGIYEDLSPRGETATRPYMWDTEEGFGDLFLRIADQVPPSVLEQFDVLKSISEDMKNTGFCRQSIFRRECDALLSLTNFPAMFYFPPGNCWDRSMDSDSDYDDCYRKRKCTTITRAFTAVSRGAIRKASRHVALVRAAFLVKGFETAEALMHSGMEYNDDQANASIKFHECIVNTAWGLARDGIIDAFRIVAREAVLKFPDDELRDCFWYTIQMADDIYERRGSDEWD